ncbi:MAG: helix-turn-helix transcriptional regulator [Clostridia bacterium]|nr:helix-turn-helix transcriptional regulator [Clostridia bacterium]
MLNKLKFLGKMVEAGYTQKSLADEINLSENTLGSRINGKSAFDTDEIEKICAAFGITDPVEKATIFLQ